VSYQDPSLQLQKAIVAVLKADAAVSALVNGRIYDAVPGGATKPYVSFGPFQLLPEHGDCLDGGEAIVTLDGWAAGPDTVQVKKLGTAIAKALDMAPIVLEEPQRCVEMSIEQTQYMRDPDGLTAHAVITVHAWTEPSNTGDYTDTITRAAVPIAGKAITPVFSGVGGGVAYTDTLTRSSVPIGGRTITPSYAPAGSIPTVETLTAGALAISGQPVMPLHAPLGLTTTITLDGLKVVFPGTLTHGVYADYEMPWVVMPPGGVLPPSYSTDPAAPVYSGDYPWQGTTAGLIGFGMMLDPDYLVKHPFDNRVEPTTGIGPGQQYDASTAIPLNVPIDHYPDGSPKTLWIARRRDAVQHGSMFSGVSHMIQITLVSVAPAANAIKPTGFKVTGGKRQVTLSDINYSAITPVPIPSGAVEPDWYSSSDPGEGHPDPAFGFLRRPMYQSGGYDPPNQVILNYIAPAFTQNDFNAYQATYTGQLLLGSISNSVHRNVLIERVVRAGLDVEAHLKWPNSRLHAGGGNTVGHKPLLFFASIWLGQPSMRAVPPDVMMYHGNFAVPYFQEDGAWFIGVPTGAFPYGKPMYGAKKDADWPAASAFGPNHDQRDPAGIYEPHAKPTVFGTARAGTSNTIQLAADFPYSDPSFYLVSLLTGPGSPQTSRINRNPAIGWDNVTKIATMESNWVGANPTSATTYQYQHGGEYHFLVPSSGMASAIAIVASGKSAEWQLTDPSGAYLFAHQRFIREEGKLNPLYPDFEYDPAQKYARMFKEFNPPTWQGLFYYSVAEALWPQQTSFRASISAGSLAITGATITDALGGPAWVTIWDYTSIWNATGGVNDGWIGYTHCLAIPRSELSAVGGNQIRLTLNAGTGGMTLSALWVGNGGGATPYAFTGTPVQLKLGGSNTVVVAALGRSTTDNGIAFVKDATNSLVMSWQFEDAAHDDVGVMSVQGTEASYYALGAHAADVAKTGYTPAGGTTLVVSKVEIFIP
jgi:hypothetical protein